MSAWLRYGDNRQKELQRKNRGDSASLAYQILMTGDIFARLYENKLKAYGFRISPTLSDGPVEIPSDVFEHHPIDLTEDNVSASGWTYERVRVVSIESQNNPKPESKAGRAPIERVNVKSVRDMGRPSTIPKLIVIIEELDRLGKFHGKLQKEIYSLVRYEARRLHPETFPRETQPSKSTIRLAFDTYRSRAAD